MSDAGEEWWTQALSGLLIGAEGRRTLADLHRNNLSQWQLEDEARAAAEIDVPRIKRAIDAHNRRRYGYIEAIDLGLAARWASADHRAAPLTETVGASLDRLSVATIRLGYARAERSSEQHAVAAQREDLARAIAANCDDLAAGRRRCPDARHYKRYGNAT